MRGTGGAGWAFAWRLALRIVGISLYAVALYAVLAGAVGATISLFELRQPEHLYTDLMGAVFFCFASWILVGGIHRLSAPRPAWVPEGVSRLGRWLYAPVLVIYLAVLYAYAVKVVATGELPKNLVSPLVIAAGMIGLLGAVLLEPVHDDDEHRGVSLLVRALPALLLPLVPLALWALGARLGEYGWTEFRYVRLAAVLAIGVLGGDRGPCGWSAGGGPCRARCPPCSRPCCCCPRWAHGARRRLAARPDGPAARGVAPRGDRSARPAGGHRAGGFRRLRAHRLRGAVPGGGAWRRRAAGRGPGAAGHDARRVGDG